MSRWRTATSESGIHYLLIGLVGLSCVLCYAPTFLWLHEKYQGANSYYSHGYLVPPVSAYLIYLKREQIFSLPMQSERWGLVLILGALVGHVLGVLGDINFVSGFSLVVYCWGLCLYLRGRAFTRQVAFALGFLVFMCPVPDVLVDRLALPLKGVATTWALIIISMADIPFVREGFRIHFADSTFFVGTPCNGMRSLISFLALGALLMYLVNAASWKKGAFMALIPCLAVVLNGLRIAVLLMIAYFFGPEAASPESYLHDGSGMVLFALGVLAMVLVVRILDRKDES